MGKVVGGDILNKKKAIPYLISLNSANFSQKEEITSLINSKDANRVEKLKLVFEEIGVKEKTEAMIADYFQLSSNSLSSIEGVDLTQIKLFAKNLMAREQ